MTIPECDPILAGATYLHDPEFGGLLYRVDDVRSNTTGYEANHALMGGSIVNYTQLEKGRFPPGTKWSKEEKDFRAYFTVADNLVQNHGHERHAAQSRAELDEVLQGVIDALEHPTLDHLPEGVAPLGYGDDVSAWLYESPNGMLVIKKYHDKPGASAKLSQSVAALNDALGVSGLEQLVTAIPEKGLVVTEFAPGVDLAHMTIDVAEQIPDEHLIGLAEALAKMQARGLVTDPNAKNFIYDHEKGITIIDFLRDQDALVSQSAVQKIATFIRALEYSPTFSLKDKYFDMSPEEFAAFAQRVTALEQKWLNVFINLNAGDQEITQELAALSQALAKHTAYSIKEQAEWHE